MTFRTALIHIDSKGDSLTRRSAVSEAEGIWKAGPMSWPVKHPHSNPRASHSALRPQSWKTRPMELILEIDRLLAENEWRLRGAVAQDSGCGLHGENFERLSGELKTPSCLPQSAFPRPLRVHRNSRISRNF